MTIEWLWLGVGVGAGLLYGVGMRRALGRLLKGEKTPGTAALTMGLLWRQGLLLLGVWALWRGCGADIPSLAIGLLGGWTLFRNRFKPV